MGGTDKKLQKIINILTANNIVPYEQISEILNDCSEILEHEAGGYRPVASDGTSGCFIDFHTDNKPLIVIPDFHARPYFLLNILEYEIFDGTTVYEALKQDNLKMVCVGDLLHTERKTRERWTAAAAEFEREIFTGPAMSSEMQEGLALLCALYYLKTVFPESVHILKGNHENILNVTGGGDFAFGKYADEGEMCRCFIQEYYGDDILYLLSCVEKNLPLLYYGKKCIISHAEPVRAFTKKELIDAHQYPGVVQGLTWTDNGDAENGSVKRTIQNLTGFEDTGDYVWLGGHRPVPEKYRLRQDGLYIQIHNPSRQNIAFINEKDKFDPEKDIIGVAK